MKQRRIVALAACMGLTAALFLESGASAKQITGIWGAEELALKKVKNATVVELDEDYDDGTHIYEVTLRKGSKKYDLTYRASDGKLIGYGWDIVGVKSSSKSIMSESKCRKLVQAKLPSGKITSIVRKRDDGIDVYKVKATTSSRRYTLEYDARTQKLIESEWDLILDKGTSGTGDGYIGVAKAKEIARGKVSGGTIVKAELDKDDGIAVYEIEIVKGNMEYEFKINAKSGKILEQDQDYMD